MASFYNEISLHRRSDVQFSSPPSPTSPPIVPYSFGEKRRGPLRVTYDLLITTGSYKIIQ
ncbi:unnamed protein product [Prunus armeniaca]